MSSSDEPSVISPFSRAFARKALVELGLREPTPAVIKLSGLRIDISDPAGVIYEKVSPDQDKIYDFLKIMMNPDSLDGNDLSLSAMGSLPNETAQPFDGPDDVLQDMPVEKDSRRRRFWNGIKGHPKK